MLSLAVGYQSPRNSASASIGSADGPRPQITTTNELKWLRYICSDIQHAKAATLTTICEMKLWSADGPRPRLFPRHQIRGPTASAEKTADPSPRSTATAVRTTLLSVATAATYEATPDWHLVQQSVFDEAKIDQWRKRLRSCVKANGRHFEHLLYNCLNCFVTFVSVLTWFSTHVILFEFDVFHWEY